MATIGLFHARAAPSSTPIDGVGAQGDRTARSALLSARASHNASLDSPDDARSLSVRVSNPFARQAAANSTARAASLAEWEMNTSQALLWFAMILPHPGSQLAQIVVEVVQG